MNTHFGLNFPPEYPLDDKSCCQLSRILLLNPRISINKVKEIISNEMLWQKIKMLNEKIALDISDITLNESDLCECEQEEQLILELLYELFHITFPIDITIDKSFNQKLFNWIVEFSFPLPCELNIIAYDTDTPKEKVFDDIYSMLFHLDMPSIKVFDYLIKYHKLLSMHQIDELLDLYLTKSKLKQIDSHVQLDIFSENNHK